MNEPSGTDLDIPNAATVSPDKGADGSGDDNATPYQVLARKYRPQTFSELIGQDALVRTLCNAIREDRIAHAFILTGVRGVGKTTTARIIAKALNCTGGQNASAGDNKGGGPTTEPCGVCDNCIAITESRHMDILEMDAASRTGINDIRELIDGVQYLPVAARYKIYIIDEVHMLSTQAFNGLLKTLEEPPAHVKFIFATTEIRKIPVTILSRCQRFDLRRVDVDELSNHFAQIAKQEAAELDLESLRLIAVAAEGSVRDGMSILDQAIAHGGGKVEAAQVRDMLGLADRGRIFDLFEAAMRGQIAAALDLLNEQYVQGADPLVVLQDLLELTHWLTRLRVAGSAGHSVSEAEQARGEEISSKLGLAQLGRAWQMLLKGLGEARLAPAALSAVEMVLIRLCYAADLPTPDDIVRKLEELKDEGGPERAAGQTADTSAGPTSSAISGNSISSAAIEDAVRPKSQSDVAVNGFSGPVGTMQTATALKVVPDPEPEISETAVETISEPMSDAAVVDDEDLEGETAVGGAAHVTDFAGVVALAELRREAKLCHDLRFGVHLIRFAQGHLEIRLNKSAPADLAQVLSKKLQEWTSERWVISVNSEVEGAATLAEAAAAVEAARRETAAAHPMVQEALSTFPNAVISDVRSVGSGTDDAIDMADASASADLDTAQEKD